ncbi:hypothetical protein GCM10029992_02260 [Glycomyces albus]
MVGRIGRRGTAVRGLGRFAVSGGGDGETRARRGHEDQDHRQCDTSPLPQTAQSVHSSLSHKGESKSAAVGCGWGPCEVRASSISAAMARATAWGSSIMAT